VSSPPAPTGLCLSSAEGSRAGHRTPRGSQQSGAKGQNPLPQPAGHTAGDAAQGMVGFLGCEHTFLGHAELIVSQHPKSFSPGLLSFHSPSSLYLCLGLPQLRCRTLHLALLNFMRFAQAHFSRLSGCLWMASLPFSTLLGVIIKLAEGALKPTAHVADKDVKQHQSQY